MRIRSFGIWAIVLATLITSIGIAEHVRPQAERAGLAKVSVVTPG